MFDHLQKSMHYHMYDITLIQKIGPVLNYLVMVTDFELRQSNTIGRVWVMSLFLVRRMASLFLAAITIIEPCWLRISSVLPPANGDV